MESTYDFKELEKKALLGSFLTEDEACALQGHLSVCAMSKQSFDFGETERKLNCGTLEADFLREQNKRFAANGPSSKGGYVTPGFGGCLIRRDRCTPMPVANLPEIILPPPGWDGRKSINRMIDRFRAKLAEISETGKWT